MAEPVMQDTRRWSHPDGTVNEAELERMQKQISTLSRWARRADGSLELISDLLAKAEQINVVAALIDKAEEEMKASAKRIDARIAQIEKTLESLGREKVEEPAPPPTEKLDRHARRQAQP